jgi:toxin ParE1/3/4
VKVHVRPAAREDVIRQYRYYLIENDAAKAAERFLDAAQSAMDALARNPGMGSPKHMSSPELDGLRTWPIRGFPSMRIYYLYSSTSMEIIRVLHGKRDVLALLERFGDEEWLAVNEIPNRASNCELSASA